MAKSRVIGLDIGTTAIRAAEIEFESGSPDHGSATLMRVGEVALPPDAVRDAEVREPQTVSSAIKQLWSKGRFSSNKAVVGVGNQRVIVRDLDLPWLPIDELKRSLPFQTQELLPVASDEVLLDFFPTGEFTGAEGKTVRGLFVAAVKDTVVANVLAVEGAGVMPTMVDLNAFAISRAQTRGELGDRVIAFVDIGARVSNVVISDRGVPRLVRIIPAGGQDVTDAVASSLQVTSAEAERIKREVGVGMGVDGAGPQASEAISTVTRTLIDTIRSTFSFYTGHNQTRPIEQLVLTGGGAMLPGLGQYLASASRLPAMMGNPTTGISLAKSVDQKILQGRENLFTLAIGLAHGVAA